MKILDIPQSGKRGLYVNYSGRNGQVSRCLAIPANPRTPAQQSVRSTFGSQSARWKSLTQPQRDAWIAAAASVQTRMRLGQAGAMTGNQLFTKLNQVLATFGQDPIELPSAYPNFATLAPQNLVITNPSGTAVLKLTCPTNPGDNTIVRASAPQSPGVARCPSLRILGTCPVPAAGSSDISSLYVAKFGTAPEGKRIFVQVSQFQDGWESAPVTFSAEVPASA
jgi:hypothetical protein